MIERSQNGGYDETREFVLRMRLPTLFCAHGGGPMPLMGADPITNAHLASLHTNAKAILVISAHWDAPQFTVSGTPSPLIFDYYGFPPETYDYKYAPPGDMGLATRVRDLLAPFDCVMENRGLDHGSFVPLMLAYPDADVPVVTLSLHASHDPELHLNVGKALAPLRDEGVLIIGSGMSFHRMSAFGHNDKPVGEEFNRALKDALRDIPGRFDKLKKWRDLPGAYYSHPRGGDEHFVPLLVAAGAALDDPATVILDATVLGANVSAFRFSNT